MSATASRPRDLSLYHGRVAGLDRLWHSNRTRVTRAHMIRYTYYWLRHGCPVKYGDTFTVSASWLMKRKVRRDAKTRYATSLRRGR